MMSRSRYLVAGFNGGVWGTFTFLLTDSFLFGLLVILVVAVLTSWAIEPRREP